ncbi:MAG: hypothetical protein ACOC2Y_02680 [Spirochaetota bacterium]
MFRTRSRISYNRPSEELFVIESNVVRRLLFGGIGLLLAVSFLVSVDWREDFAGEMIAGTVFYFVVTAICLAVAGWNSRVELDRHAGEVRFVKRFAGVALSTSVVPAAEVTAVVVQGIRFLRDDEKAGATLLGSRFRRYVERRNVYYKLQLETEEKLRFVEDSTDFAELEPAAKAMAEFLEVTYRHEEL